MNRNEYDEGYRFGAGSTQDQKEGARAAISDRLKKEREAAESWRRYEAAAREREESEQQSLERIRSDIRKHKEEKYAPAQPTKTYPPKVPTTESSDWSISAAMLGFFISAALASGQVQDTGNAGLSIIMAGVFGAVIIGRFYKEIIYILVLIAILAAIAGSK